MKGWWKTRNGNIAHILFDHVDGKYLTGYVYIFYSTDKYIKVFTAWDKLTKDHVFQEELDLVTKQRYCETWPELSVIARQEPDAPVDLYE